MLNWDDNKTTKKMTFLWIILSSYSSITINYSLYS